MPPQPSSQPPPLAKSSGVLLTEHNRHLQEQADAYFGARPFVADKYRRLTGGQDLPELVRVAIRWHDEGKKHPDWKKACRADYDELQAFNARCAADYAALGPSPPEDYETFRRRRKPPRGKHLKQVGIRHEMASLEFIRGRKVDVPLPVRTAIGAHHRKLSHRHRDRWSDEKDFEQHWNEFFRVSETIRIGHAEDFDKAIRQRYEFAGPRALLQLADHRASAQEDSKPGETLPPFEPFRYTWPEGWTERGVQKLIRTLWDEPFAILRAPTGSGKTDAALLWAKHQIEKGRADRLVIAMPTRFTANALSISTRANLSANGLYHSSAWFQRLKDQANPTPAEKRFIDKEQELARLLETPVTVTTLDHLCICLTGTREDHHAIFFGLARSCVVIDEADFYDPFTQANLVVLLRSLRLLDVRVLLMSATVPQSACDLYAKSGFPKPRIHKDITDADRIRCTITRRGKAETPDDVSDLLERALAGEPTIVYANTVRRAQAYYDWFRRKKFNPEHLVLYHGRFTEPHKADIEDRLRDMLGAAAWKAGTARGVAILTQIGELSVNISADLMISDLCPLDRLTQRAGRLSRFWPDGGSKSRGELYIVMPYRKHKDGEAKFYPAPYGTYKNGVGWKPAEALTTSDTLLVPGDYSAKRFVDLVDELYPTVPPEPSDIRVNRQALEDCIALNWLLLPKEWSQEDDDHTKDWRSRDIPPQVTVYADYETSAQDWNQWFPNWSRWREFQLRHGIPCYVYEFKRAEEIGCLEKVTFVIGDSDRREDKEEAWLVKPQFYNPKTGLTFPDEE